MQRHGCSYQSGISPYYVSRRSLTLCSSVLHDCHQYSYCDATLFLPPSQAAVRAQLLVVGIVQARGNSWALLGPDSIARRRSSGCGSIALLFIVHGSATVEYEFRCQLRRVRVPVSVASSTSSPAPATSSHTLS